MVTYYHVAMGWAETDTEAARCLARRIAEIEKKDGFKIVGHIGGVSVSDTYRPIEEDPHRYIKRRMYAQALWVERDDSTPGES